PRTRPRRPVPLGPGPCRPPPAFMTDIDPRGGRATVCLWGPPPLRISAPREPNLSDRGTSGRTLRCGDLRSYRLVLRPVLVQPIFHEAAHGVVTGAQREVAVEHGGPPARAGAPGRPAEVQLANEVPKRDAVVVDGAAEA